MVLSNILPYSRNNYYSTNIPKYFTEYEHSVIWKGVEYLDGSLGVDSIGLIYTFEDGTEAEAAINVRLTDEDEDLTHYKEIIPSASEMTAANATVMPYILNSEWVPPGRSSDGKFVEIPKWMSAGVDLLFGTFEDFVAKAPGGRLYKVANKLGLLPVPDL